MLMLSTANLNLTALCREGRLKEALHILLTTHDPPAHFSTYLQLLQTRTANDALSQGKQIHSLVTHRGFAFATAAIFQNKIIHMYVKCSSLVDACKVFYNMTERNVISWNIIIAAYRKHGHPHEALKLFHQMQQSGFQPDEFTFATILPACAKLRALEEGMDIHQSVKERGIFSDVVTNALVDMYAKCGSIRKARELFDKMPQKNVVCCTAMIAGYAQNGVLDEALRLFKEMPQRNVVSWNVMIAGYAQNGFDEQALETFKQMQLVGVKPESATFATILPACAKMGALDEGMNIHRSIVERGILSDVIISALVDMYAKCGSIHKAHELFDKTPQRDAILWTSMISGYAKNGFVEKAVESFKKMQLAGLKPDSTTFASILPAFAKMRALEQGLDIHQSIIERGFLSNVVVANALVDLYAKCDSIHKAHELFNKMPKKNVVSWNTIITGFVQDGLVEKALETFKKMQLAGVKPDFTTFASILPACAKMGALEQGMDIHQRIIESGILSDLVLASALVDMYAKCGNMQMARKLFDKILQRNVISWNAMIAGYAQNGFCNDALVLFEQMIRSGIYPDYVTFACVLLACSHAGLVDEGCKYFNGISDSYYITPTFDHYVCMVDLLGRAGYLEETLNFIIKMPTKPMVVVWTCLLGACRPHKNIGLGIFAANLLFDLDPENAATYVLLSNIYAEVGEWGEVQMVRRLMKDRGIRKVPGCSWIEGHKMVHAFCVKD